MSCYQVKEDQYMLFLLLTTGEDDYQGCDVLVVFNATFNNISVISWG